MTYRGISGSIGDLISIPNSSPESSVRRKCPAHYWLGIIVFAPPYTGNIRISISVKITICYV